MAGHRLSTVLIRLAVAVVAVGCVLPAAADSDNATAGDVGRVGRGAPGGVCARLFEIRLSDGHVLCTHGPDPAPLEVDRRLPRPLAAGARPQGLLFPDNPGGSAETTAQVTPGIGCYGDGQSGNRVQAVYAVPAGTPDRYAQVASSIRQWAAETDQVFQLSAAKTGGQRHVRFVTDAACNLIVQRVELTAAGAQTFQNTIAEFQAQGLNRPDRKYLVWMDATELCGIATFYIDDQPSGKNLNNGSGAPGSIARIDSGCWGLASRGESVEAHELMHTLGAVEPTAPHSSPAGHCDDSSDRMCYQDGTVLALLGLCPTNQGALFDCGNDDYFSTAPAPGNYLATHWNTANNSFLSADFNTPPVPVPPASPPPPGQGYWFVAADGGIFAFGDSRFYGSTGNLHLNQPIVAMAATRSGHGYWLVARDGGIFAFGDASFYGSAGSLHLNQPIVGMAATPTGAGYWMVATDGGIFAFGDARFYGTPRPAAQSIVGLTATPTGAGYWLVAADGGVFSYGDARSFGTPGRGAQPIVGLTDTPSGAGYWMAGRDGAVFAFGDAHPFGSTGELNQPIVGLAATPKGTGYWLVARDGGIFAFGDARFYGSAGDIKLNQSIVDMAAAPER